MTNSKILKIKVLNPFQLEQIDQAWNDEYPLKLTKRFGILLDGTDNHLYYLMEDLDNKVVAWGVMFEKEAEKRFSIIVFNKFKGFGYGRRIIDEFRKDHSTFYGWVIDHDNDVKSNGEKYISPMPFYLKLGFKVLRDQRIDTEIISAVKISYGV